MEYKTVDAEVKAIDEKGEGVLRFIRFNQEDKDSDITLPGFIGRQAAWILPAHNWKSDRPPLGDGESFESDGATHFRVKLNLDLPLAREWHTHLKFDYERRRLQQISYGFSPFADGQERGQKDGKSVRFLKPRADGSPGAKLHEVSFVVVGSGNDTGVLSIKSPEIPLVDEVSVLDVKVDAPMPDIVSVPEPDSKRYDIEQLLDMIDWNVRDVLMTGKYRYQDGKKYADETVAKFDRVSQRFDELRALVKLGPVQRDSLDEEWQARHQAINAQISREQDALFTQEQQKNELLYQKFLERSASLDKLLYPQSS
jgi:hypothetical protein